MAQPSEREIREELEREIDAIAGILSPKRQYSELRKILDMALRHLTKDTSTAFAGPYPMLLYVCQTYGIRDIRPLNNMRRRCRYAHKIPEARLAATFETDKETLRKLTGLIGHEGETAAWAEATTETEAVKETTEKERDRRVMRVSVTRRLGDGKVEVMRQEDAAKVTVDMRGDIELETKIKEGDQLNLIDTKTGRDGTLTPWLTILEPDILVDVTSIASCFTPTADTHEWAIINRIKPKPTTRHILLGNMAGQMLDEALTCMRDGRDPSGLSYRDSVGRFFGSNALALAASTDVDATWHQDAQQQQRNVAEMIKTLSQKDRNFNIDLTMTEPSFVSEALGIQGRMDLLQTDFRLLVEQKSGKKNDYKHTHREEHYVQIVLYQLLLNLQFDVKATETSQYLMYSRYGSAEGLIREGTSPAELIQKIFKIRNGIVYDNIRYTKASELRKDLGEWTAERFRDKKVGDKLWDLYTLPSLESVLRPIQTAPKLVQDYFFEMLAFIQRESILSRIGNSTKEGSGFASLWTTAAADRRRTGNLMDRLQIMHLGKDTDDTTMLWMEGSRAVDVVELTVPREVNTEDDSTDSIPNFRVGDVVILYDYTSGDEPDVRDAVECRATIIDLEAETITVKLRSAQSSTFFTSKRGRQWALEHDLLDSQSSNLGRQLNTMMTANTERRDLLIGTRRAKAACKVDELDKIALTRDYGAASNEVVRRVKASQELFLLMGPPGTGKTSHGLVSILTETLSESGKTALLMAYTNRAVDEICSKLEKNGIEYLRIGSRFSCAPEYRRRLLNHQGYANVNEIRESIYATRVIVGTTASISGNMNLFELKHFDIAIVDEASQILEPSIVGILSAKNREGEDGRASNAIDKIVLIGDHKQLPAVVTQKKTASAVHAKNLHSIGLQDCRESFFQRMMRLYSDDEVLTYTLTRQGRMHEETAAFANRHFYGGRLQTVPLPHQTAELKFTTYDHEDELEKKMATRRTIYIDSKGDGEKNMVTDEKVNQREAEIIAEVIRKAVRLRRANGMTVDSGATLGVVVPYRNQIGAIRQRLAEKIEPQDSVEDRQFYENLTIDTVERLQGSERDIIIYGFTVRRVHQLSFLTDSEYEEADGTVIDRKLNVALTRAREQTIVVGDSEIISKIELYKELIEEMSDGE